MNLRKIINLSPLVDVLMIVIFWYIMMSNQTIEETKETAQNELSALQNRYETELTAAEQENKGLAEQVEGLTGEVESLTAEKDTLLQEKEALAAETETYRQVNDDLSDQLAILRDENNALGLMLEQSVGYLYIRLYDGLHKNRIVEVNSDIELVDKFVFSSDEGDFLQERIEKVVTEYAQRDEKTRVSVIFMYEGSKAYYLDVNRIKSALYGLRTEYNLSIFMLNLAE